MKKRSKIGFVWICIILCFLLMASPLVLYLNSLDTLIFGVPPLYAFVFVLWVCLCILTFIGYQLRWGEKKNDPRK